MADTDLPYEKFVRLARLHPGDVLWIFRAKRADEIGYIAAWVADEQTARDCAAFSAEKSGSVLTGDCKRYVYGSDKKMVPA